MLLQLFNQWSRHILLHHFRTAPGNAVLWAPAMIVHLPSPCEECRQVRGYGVPRLVFPASLPFGGVWSKTL